MRANAGSPPQCEKQPHHRRLYHDSNFSPARLANFAQFPTERTDLYDIIGLVTSSELLRKLKKLAKRRGLDLSVEAGKGSHRKVQLGQMRTIIPVHRVDLKTGTLNGILADLGIRKEDL